ncbi:MAG: hypothetical protein FWG82_01085 [Oscillospiraceae bacterium]|nr:hypothetical protein [Oscillospiraceae bacterium]
MFCPKCGKSMQDGGVCQACGYSAAPQAAEPPQKDAPQAYSYQPTPPAGETPAQQSYAYGSPQQPYYPQGTYDYNQAMNPNDQASTLLNLIGCCIPLAGLIMYLTMKDDTPNKAKAIAKWAVIGLVASAVIGIVFGIIYGVVIVGALAAAGGDWEELLREFDPNNDFGFDFGSPDGFMPDDFGFDLPDSF